MNAPIDRPKRPQRIYLYAFVAATWLLTVLGVVIKIFGGVPAWAMVLGCGLWALMFHRPTLERLDSAIERWIQRRGA